MSNGRHSRLRIAFATWSGMPELHPDDQLGARAFRQRGHEVFATPWDLAAVDWSAFDAIVLRTTWNYHLAYERFASWLGHVEGVQGCLFNSPAIVRWNAHKRYLLELQELGVTIPSTVYLEQGTSARLADVLAQIGWTAAVVKPAVSAGAHQTTLVGSGPDEDDEGRFSLLLAEGDVLVQELVAEIRDRGEHSLVFFDREFSHAVVKRPRNGEFRIQPWHGGTVEPASVPTTLIDQCAGILESVPGSPVYARVDGVLTRTGWKLMEIEAIEPSLFFSSAEGAADRFAAALLRRLTR